MRHTPKNTPKLLLRLINKLTDIKNIPAGCPFAQLYWFWVVSFLFRGFIDVLHRDIGKAQTDEKLVVIHIAFLSAIILLPWFYIVMDWRHTKRIKASVLKEAFQRKEKELSNEEFIEN
jgi:hypothetical protein